MEDSEINGNSKMIIQQRMEAVIKLGEMPCRDQEEDDLKAQIAWFTEIATLLKELIDLGKKKSEDRDLQWNKSKGSNFEDSNYT